jgi:hypothetical protein
LIANFLHVVLSIAGAISSTMLGWIGENNEFNSRDIIGIQVRALFAALISYSIFYGAEKGSIYTLIVAFMAGMLVDSLVQGIQILIQYLRRVGLLL